VMGWACPVNRYTHTIEIGRPAPEVFAFISQPENFQRWQSSLLEIRREAKGPLREGAEVTEVRRFLGREMETTWICTEHEPCSRSTIEADEGPVPFRGTFELEQVGRSTRFTWIVETPGPRGIKVPGAIVGRMVRRELEANCARLKQLLERGGGRELGGVGSAA
jgi:carbon monoxide dehydrogenase subunit G